MAFKPNALTQKKAGQWFQYIGPQSPGHPATLADAHTPLNYQYASNAIPAAGSGYLNAIYVQESEIDNNGTPNDLTDDLPTTDDKTTDCYQALFLAKDTQSGTWSDLTYNTATVNADDQP